MASISRLINESGLGGPAKRALRELFEAVLDDQQMLGAKMDQDAGVTDTNYAAKLADPKKSAGLTK